MIYRKRKFIINFFCGFIILILFCEYIVYYVVLFQCKWPILNSENNRTVKFMVLADTHLLGSRNGHWFDKLRREWQMYRTFQTAIILHSPDLVFVLGDLTDEGHFCSPEEFEYHAKRFFKMFSVPIRTQMYVSVGNHDIGFHYSITPYKNERFIKAFNSSSVQFINVKGNYFVLINSMALEGDGCFLCKSAEKEIVKIENILKCYNDSSYCKTKIKRETYSKPILMQHFPLYRKSDEDCHEPDEAPSPLKQQIFREKWDCISRESTDQLLRQLKPRLVVSGHTHHGCTRSLPNNEGIEVTLPSFSWRNKNNPSFGMFVVNPNEYLFSKCYMPVESQIIRIYIIGSIVLFVWIIYSYTLYSKKKKYKYKY